MVDLLQTVQKLISRLVMLNSSRLVMLNSSETPSNPKVDVVGWAK